MPPRGVVRVSPDFLSIRPLIDLAANARTFHPPRMSCVHCELSEQAEETKPPDPDFVALIEWAFLESQIDGQTADLAFLRFLQGFATRASSFAGTKAN